MKTIRPGVVVHEVAGGGVYIVHTTGPTGYWRDPMTQVMPPQMSVAESITLNKTVMDSYERAVIAGADPAAESVFGWKSKAAQTGGAMERDEYGKPSWLDTLPLVCREAMNEARRVREQPRCVTAEEIWELVKHDVTPRVIRTTPPHGEWSTVCACGSHAASTQDASFAPIATPRTYACERGHVFGGARGPLCKWCFAGCYRDHYEKRWKCEAHGGQE